MATTALAHAEALITQLVFEHSLRIRLVAETNDDANASQGHNSPSGAGTPDTASVAGSSANVSASVSSTVNDGSKSPADAKSMSTLTSTVPKGKSKDTGAQTPTSVKPQSKKESLSKKDSNLIGKINNLVTTDLGNITDSRDFLLVGSSYIEVDMLLTYADQSYV